MDVSDSEPTPSKTRTDSWPEAREGSVASEHHSCEAAATSASLEGDLRSGVSKHAATRTASRVTGGTPKARAAHPQDSLGDAARKERARQTTRRLRAGQQVTLKMRHRIPPVRLIFAIGIMTRDGHHLLGYAQL